MERRSSCGKLEHAFALRGKQKDTVQTKAQREGGTNVEVTRVTLMPVFTNWSCTLLTFSHLGRLICLPAHQRMLLFAANTQRSCIIWANKRTVSGPEFLLDVD